MSHKAQASNQRLERALESLYATEPPFESWQSAQKRLGATLSSATQQVVLYGFLEHPITSHLIMAIRNSRVAAIQFGHEKATLTQQLEKQFGQPIYFAPQETAEPLAQLRDYLDGKRTAFELPVDISLLTEFQQQVLRAAQQIPRGKITTYGEIAQRIGSPKAVRAVGQALGRNPIPIVIPCHRVIAANGALGGYSGGGGLETKARLLQLEGVRFA
jgi:O-6-methylguanine DNA methyltransferase